MYGSDVPPMSIAGSSEPWMTPTDSCRQQAIYNTLQHTTREMTVSITSGDARSYSCWSTSGAPNLLSGHNSLGRCNGVLALSMW